MRHAWSIFSAFVGNMFDQVSIGGMFKCPPQHFGRRMSRVVRVGTVRVKYVQKIVVIRKNAKTCPRLQYLTHQFSRSHYGELFFLTIGQQFWAQKTFPTETPEVRVPDKRGIFHFPDVGLVWPFLTRTIKKHRCKGRFSSTHPDGITLRSFLMLIYNCWTT